ncbi:MAG: sigma-70 family RNA polymerase sigma factor [Hyphomicrobiales bacterium]
MQVAVAHMSENKSLRKPAGIQVEMANHLAQIAERQDREAFRDVFLHFGPRLKSFMIKKGADVNQAEELVQETMLTVWRKASLYSPEKGTVTTWMYTIARNLRIDRIRRESSQQFTDLEDYDAPSDDPGSDDQVSLMQQQVQVREALKLLPEEQRKIIHMSYILDMPQSEIAERLDLPLGTVKSRMRLAYRKLRKTLEGAL